MENNEVEGKSNKKWHHLKTQKDEKKHHRFQEEYFSCNGLFNGEKYHK